MDVQQILVALSHTYHQGENERKQAEVHLKQWQTTPGYLVLLLQIVASNDVDPAIRQAAAINLKNMAKKWRPPVDPDPSDPPPLDFPENDRITVKENIIEALVHAPPLVRNQLGSAITAICSSDFPDKWEGFVPKIASFITTQNPSYMHGALVALLMAFKKYSFISSGKKRKPLHNLVKTIFPLLLQLFTALSTNDSLESASLQRLVCKIFYCSTNMSIPPFLVEGDTLGKWVGLFQILLEKPVPEEIQPADIGERPAFPWWAAKKVAAKIVERCIRRYGKPKPVDKKSNKMFATAFSTVYSVRVMETLLRVMAIKRGGGGYLPDKFTQSVLSYIRMCLRFGLTYTVLKPHIEVLTQEILFPYLCLSEQDKTLWDEDPVEYLRKEFDPLEEFHNPRTETIYFITDLVMHRGKQTLNKFMTFVVQLLIKYTSTPENARNYREKDGCLHAIGALAPWLKRVPEYKTNLERMLLVHVFPEFSSPFGFLRARACWIFSQFHNVRFTNEDNFSGAVQKVLSMMHDPELPVRVQAGLALRFLILSPRAENVLRPFLPQVLEAIFKLMSEIDSDDLVATLERLIFHYGAEIAPYSVALCQRLTEAFMKLYKVADEEDDNASAAAMECLMAMRSLLRGVRTMPHIYAQVNPIILAMLVETLNDNSIEYFEELLRILTFCTFYGEVKPMWPTFTLIYTCFDLWASDFIDDMVPPLDNFISRDTETFLAGPYLEMILKMYNKLVGTHDSDERDAGQATELIESVLHNCRGRVDHIIPDVISITAARLQVCEDKDFKILLIEIIANALYYNPGLTLQIMEAKGLTQSIFGLWLQAMPLFKRQFDIKLIVLGLSAIFELRLATLPPLIQFGAKQIMESLVKLLKKSEDLKKDFDRKMEQYKLDKEHEQAHAEKEAKERAEKAAKQQPNGAPAGGHLEGEDSDDEGEYEIKEVADDADISTVGSDDEDMEFAMLAENLEGDGQVDLGDSSDSEAEVEDAEGDKDGEEIEEEEEEDDEDEDEDDDDDDDDDDSSDEEYITPIDRVDELVYFASRMHAMATTDPMLQNLLGVLSPEDQKQVQVLVESAKTREAENAKKEQERLRKIQEKANRKK